jgi:hypothetical protein
MWIPTFTHSGQAEARMIKKIEVQVSVFMFELVPYLYENDLFISTMFLNMTIF